MAAITTVNIVSDLGSQEVAQLVTSYNALAEALGDLITGMKTAADTAAINALAVTAETALVNNVKYIQGTPGIPLAPTGAAV